MKTVAELARELGVSKQAIHKRIKKEPLKSCLQGLTVTVDNSLRFDDEGESFVKSAFGRNEASTATADEVDVLANCVDELSKMVDKTAKNGATSSTLVDEVVNERDEASTEIIQVLKDEIAFLRRQLNEERAHNRELSEKMLPLIEQAQKITENAQTLHAMESVKPQLTDGKKSGIFSRFFRK